MKAKYYFAFLLAIFLLPRCTSSSNADTMKYYVMDEHDFMKVNRILEINNETIYRLFEMAKINDSISNVQIYYEKAMKIKFNSRNITLFIEVIKSELKQKAMNIDKKIADTTSTESLPNPGDVSVSTKCMVGDDPANVQGHGKELKVKLIQYHDALVEMCGSNSDIKRMLKDLECNDQYDAQTGKHMAWEWFYFYRTPLVATLARLTAIQNEVKSAEGMAITELYGQMISNK